jgi:predicted branched-subunit amino acid permease
MIRRGFADALPIIIGYIPMGAAYAILARQTGMGFFPTVLMSLIVFAGASQFIAVGLLSGGATALEVVATTLFVNLRHILMSRHLHRALYFRRGRPQVRARPSLYSLRQLGLRYGSGSACGSSHPVSTFMGGTWNIITAAMAGATLGLILEMKLGKMSQGGTCQ